MTVLNLWATRYEMRVWLAYGLVLVILLPLCGKLVIISHFSLRRAEISQTLCENKDRPEMHCQGNCQLRKRLAAAEPHIEQGQAPTQNPVFELAELIYLSGDALLLHAAATKAEKEIYPVFYFPTLSGHHMRLEQPPQVG